MQSDSGLGTNTCNPGLDTPPALSPRPSRLAWSVTPCTPCLSVHAEDGQDPASTGCPPVHPGVSHTPTHANSLPTQHSDPLEAQPCRCTAPREAEAYIPQSRVACRRCWGPRGSLRQSRPQRHQHTSRSLSVAAMVRRFMRLGAVRCRRSVECVLLPVGTQQPLTTSVTVPLSVGGLVRGRSGMLPTGPRG